MAHEIQGVSRLENCLLFNRVVFYARVISTSRTVAGDQNDGWRPRANHGRHFTSVVDGSAIKNLSFMRQTRNHVNRGQRAMRQSRAVRLAICRCRGKWHSSVLTAINGVYDVSPNQQKTKAIKQTRKRQFSFSQDIAPTSIGKHLF